MDILGLTGTQAALLITVLGVAATNLIGWLRSEDSFDLRKTASSIIIGLTIGLFTVATELNAIKSTLGELEQLIIVAALIGQIAGFDYFTKKGIKAIKK